MSDDPQVEAARLRDEQGARSLGAYTPTAQALEMAEQKAQEWQAMREIVEAVADASPAGPMVPSGHEWICGFCGGTGPWRSIQHLEIEGLPPCPVTKARAILAADDPSQ